MQTMEVEKIEDCVAINFCDLEGRSAKEIYDRLATVYGPSVPSFSTVTRWFNEFKRGRRSLEDDTRSGRPTTAVNPDLIEAVKQIIMEDRRIKVAHIATMTGISVGSTETIIRDRLKM